MKSNRRSILKKFTGILGLMALTTPLWAKSWQRPQKAKFIHMVFFWLKPETSVSDFIDQTTQFVSQVKTVKTYYLGQPAMTPREIVDNSYSVSLVVTFDSKEDQDQYQTDPIHVAYVEANKDRWTDVKIYDAWNDN